MREAEHPDPDATLRDLVAVDDATLLALESDELAEADE